MKAMLVDENNKFLCGVRLPGVPPIGSTITVDKKPAALGKQYFIVKDVAFCYSEWSPEEDAWVTLVVEKQTVH